MHEGLISPMGRDGFNELRVRGGKIPKEGEFWPDDYDAIVQKRAGRTSDGEPVDENDPLSILMAREEGKLSDEEVKPTSGWSNYNGEGGKDSEIGGTVTRASAEVVGSRRAAGLTKSERHVGTRPPVGVAEKREMTSKSRGKAKRK